MSEHGLGATRGLTVKRPWDWAIRNGKPLENRHCKFPKHLYGQRIALHSGVSYDHAAVPFIAKILKGKVPVDAELTSRVVTCTAIVLGWVCFDGSFDGVTAKQAKEARASRWFMGPYAWVLDDLRVLRQPVAVRGMNGLFPLKLDEKLAILAAGG